MSNHTPSPYIIFGATGKVGKELVSIFSAAAIPVVAVTRDPAKITVQPFVSWEVADLADKERVLEIVHGSSGIFLATSYSDKMVELQGNVITAAVKAGVSPIVKLSAKGVVENPDGIASKAHAQVELSIKATGMPYTILQPASFMQGWLGTYLKTIQEEKKIYEAVGDARIPFIDTLDIAEVAFHALTAPEKHQNKSYVLTGGAALNYYELAAIFSDILGEKIIYVPQTPEAARMRMEKEGKPPLLINFFLNWAKSQQEASGHVSPSVQEILGKPPRRLQDFLQEYAHALK